MKISVQRKAIKDIFDDYYAELADYASRGVTNEEGLRPAFQHLLKRLKPEGWTLILEERRPDRCKPDGTLCDGLNLQHGHWEAKDPKDDLETEIRKKIKKGYPTTNIIFENTQRGILIQQGKRVRDIDMHQPTQLAQMLQQFFNHVEPLVSQGTPLLTYLGHKGYVTTLAWSPDGTQIASAEELLRYPRYAPSASTNNTVQVWDAATGARVFTYYGHKHDVLAVAWSPDGKLIASAGKDGTIQVWDTTRQYKPTVYEHHSPTGHVQPIRTLCWSPDSTRIAFGSSDTNVQVWDVTSNRKLFVYPGHHDEVMAVAWSPDGKYIASSSADKTVQIWGADTRAQFCIYRGHSLTVVALAWSPDSKYIASGSKDRTVQVWEAHTEHHLLTYRGHCFTVGAVAWSPDGKRIASAGGPTDNTVQIWDAPIDGWDEATRGHVFIYEGHTAAIFALAWSPDGTHIASGDEDMTVQIWQAK